MTEQEYINVRELSSVLCAIDCLKQITPQNSACINPDDYKLVMEKLKGWEIDLFNICVIKES